MGHLSIFTLRCCYALGQTFGKENILENIPNFIVHFDRKYVRIYHLSRIKPLYHAYIVCTTYVYIYIRFYRLPIYASINFFLFLFFGKNFRGKRSWGSKNPY